jgi:hypothetical protein
VKGVPECLKLSVAVKAVTDNCAKQWFTAVYKDLTSYDDFKKSVTELLWNPQIQSQVRISLCQDNFDKTENETMSARFLRYSVLAANLSPRLKVTSCGCDFRSFSAIRSTCALVSECAKCTGRIDFLTKA